MTASSIRPNLSAYSIVVIIPAFRVESRIEGVLSSLPAYIRHIIVINDASPDRTAEVVQQFCQQDRRVTLVNHDRNRGVGAAMITGLEMARKLGAQFVIKMDGDGQMPAERIPDLLDPLLRGAADFAKGNRFRDFKALTRMPVIRRIGNTALSFLAKAATGYWNCFDPTNGFTAIRGELLSRLPMDRLDRNYFFEISLLSRLYLLDATIEEVPMSAQYADEISSMSIGKVIFAFPPKLLLAFFRRIVLKYFVYDFSIVSLYLLTGLPLLLFGTVFGAYNWARYSQLGIPAPTGTIMLATLPVILGFQLLLSATGADLQSVPRQPLCKPVISSDMSDEMLSERG